MAENSNNVRQKTHNDLKITALVVILFNLYSAYNYFRAYKHDDTLITHTGSNMALGISYVLLLALALIGLAKKSRAIIFTVMGISILLLVLKIAGWIS